MDITIMHPTADVHQKLAEYERELNRAHDEELAEVVAGLEAMTNGWPVIHLSNAIEEGGCDDLGRPNLAVARADKKRVHLDSKSPGDWRYSWRDRNRLVFNSWGDGNSSAPFNYDGLLISDVRVSWNLSREGRRSYADVPIIPPGPRRKAGGKTRLKHHLVLWDVEEWHGGTKPRAPEDPLLLRPLKGEMYAVIAQWDLTPLERAVIAGRRF